VVQRIRNEEHGGTCLRLSGSQALSEAAWPMALKRMHGGKLPTELPKVVTFRASRPIPNTLQKTIIRNDQRRASLPLVLPRRFLFVEGQKFDQTCLALSLSEGNGGTKWPPHWTSRSYSFLIITIPTTAAPPSTSSSPELLHRRLFGGSKPRSYPSLGLHGLTTSESSPSCTPTYNGGFVTSESQFRTRRSSERLCK
jgi:hypothetical protein